MCPKIIIALETSTNIDPFFFYNEKFQLLTSSSRGLGVRKAGLYRFGIHNFRLQIVPLNFIYIYILFCY